ncbi:PREDICTED: probable glycerol-3-phosphate acyltransferase 2 [Brassica oleracea var. oleracea]|uniref:Phospholipid/glycerol acyltransferase domain-containing protein n=1 Tax=Brassica oleracea var. oleracea TaxID=109376 RepID=A0A0D3C744_BRAOL|nr:PREDICTED: probable glycerol-3-phosphate acyltransferase 2 [Brassica oleracea var. oleracea]
MSGNKVSIFQGLFLFFYRFFIHRRWFHRNPKQKHQKSPSHHGLHQAHDLSPHTLIFNVEGALLKSNTLFPYFMLLAFETGGVIRSFLLFILYPFISLMSYELGMKTMVMVSFFGIKKENFLLGKSVLPKYFLEDVGLEMFEVLKRGGKRVGVSDLPQVMIDGFLEDYLGIEVVVGREMKMIGGYYSGILEDKKKHEFYLGELVQEEKLSSGHVIGITSYNLPSHRSLFSQFCQEIYFVRNSDKKSWQTLPRNQYPRPLIFHDGRLAIKPTPTNTLALFMWAPFASVLATARTVAGLNLPYSLAIPFLAFSGFRLTLTVNNDLISPDQKEGCLFVCNHRTLLDPLYISYALRKTNIKAVTYSLSRLSELLAPIKTVRLTRDRVQDGQAMKRLLRQGDLVVCPEGTTCREPYLLRFSPLFAEVSDAIVPVAIDSHVTFFHGTTASGLKAFDPIFFLLNPYPTYTVRLLDPVFGGGSSTCRDPDDGKSKFEVANHVQHEIGKALGFECTNLTRRDKYLILAGNNGVVDKK